MSDLQQAIADAKRRSRIEQCRKFGKNNRLQQSLQQQLDCLCEDLTGLFAVAARYKGELPSDFRAELLVVFERVKSIERQDERKTFKKTG